MTDHFGKFKTSTYLPSDDNAPEFIKQFYAKPALDFDPASVKPDELNTIESLTHDLCLDFTIYRQLFADQESRDKAYTLGSTVMFTLERALLFRICLRFSALIGDKSNERWSSDKRVISISEIIKDLNSDRLNSLRDQFIEFYRASGLEFWRNKFAAHNDKNMLIQGEKPLLLVTSIQIHEELQKLNDFINLLKGEQHVLTDVEVQTIFGTGADKFFATIKKISE